MEARKCLWVFLHREVVALVNYMNQILIALIALANLIVAVTKAMASGVRLNEVLDTQPSLTDQAIVFRKKMQALQELSLKM